MRKYELIVVVNQSLQDEEVDAVVDGIQKLISEAKGEVAEIDKWGRRELATEFDGHTTGNYVLIRFNSDADVTHKLNGSLKVNEKVILYLLTKVEEKKKRVARRKRMEKKADGKPQ